MEPAVLSKKLQQWGPVCVVTGAGISTASGVGDYRDRSGAWKRKQPITLSTFMASEHGRARYWARSLIGWPPFSRAQPNAAHHALVAWERQQGLTGIVTQNVDRLHQRAGAQQVIDLHGRLDQAVCLSCGSRSGRAYWQDWLAEQNPDFMTLSAEAAPDGDADLTEADFAQFVVPDCQACGGIIKPDVVFYGENVPKPRVAEARAMLDEAGALLVIGSSLMVYSGYRFVRWARAQDKPVIIINEGVTRGDADATLKIEAPVQKYLPVLVVSCA